MAKKDKLKLTVKGDKFTDFISKLDDLTKIGDIIKLKIDQESILMYSLIGETAVLAFKSYQIKTSDYFDFEEFDYSLDYVILGAKKFVKNFSFLNVKNKVELEISFKDSPDTEEIKHVRAIVGTDTRLKLAGVGGEQYKVRDMSIDKLNKVLDIENSKWEFKVKKDDFADIKKLSSINDDKIISISVTGGKVSFSELGKWQLDVDKLDEDHNNLVFGKKYLNSVNLNEDFVNFNIFESFILIRDKESNFMMSFEQSFEDDVE
jgi:hypothetical protein